LTTSVLGLSAGMKASCVTYVLPAIVSPASMPLKEMLTLSPGRMSGVTLRPVPAPQQYPPGWLISKATSPSSTVPLAEPMTWPLRVTSTSASSPMWFW